MDKVTFEYLAKQLNIGKTTVSRAMNDCPGINPCTKKKILDVAEGLGYKPSKATGKVAIVLPSLPDYFWGDIRRKLSKFVNAAKLECAMFIYSDLYNISDAKRCVDSAIESGASAIIASLPDTKEICDRLEEVSERRLVICLEEFLSVKNGFFVGENSEFHGGEVARRYMEINPDARRFAIVHSNSYKTIRKRVDSFFAEIKKHGAGICCDIALSGRKKAVAAYIATLLSEKDEKIDCIFCPSGLVPEICLAIKKIKRPIHCIGFDKKKPEDTVTDSDIIKLTVCQNLNMQIETAVDYVVKFVRSAMFPPQKNTYINDAYYE